MDKKSRLKAELRLTETGRDFLENVELPKHTNSLPPKVNDKVEPYKKINTIPIPEGATNGDMILLTRMFSVVKELNDGIMVYVKPKGVFGQVLEYPKDWWNAKYKKDCIPSEYDYSEDMELRNPQMHR